MEYDPQKLLDIVLAIADGDDCQYDHHDYCQTHLLHERPCPWELANLVAQGKPLPEAQAEPPETETATCCCSTINYHSKCDSPAEVEGYCKLCYSRCLPADVAE